MYNLRDEDTLLEIPVSAFHLFIFISFFGLFDFLLFAFLFTFLCQNVHRIRVVLFVGVSLKSFLSLHISSRKYFDR